MRNLIASPLQQLRKWWLIATVVIVGLLSYWAHHLDRFSEKSSSLEETTARFERLFANTGPRTPGSHSHELVRHRLVDELQSLGLEVTVQEDRSCTFRSCSRLANVVAELKGTTAGRKLILSAHYDTVPASDGFADDGAAVVALLGAAANLSHERRPARSIVFLFSDGEESGLTGARLFAENSRLAANIGLIVNFEAAGSTGPSFLFESSADSGALVAAVDRATPRPVVASSFFTSIYRLSRSSTDLSVFIPDGYSALNFAFTETPTVYHTQLDDRSHLDLESVRHHESIALGLARDWSTREISSGSPPAVFFDVFGVFIAQWPAKFAIAFASLVFAANIITSWIRRSRVRNGRKVLYFLAATGALAMSIAVSIGLHFVIVNTLSPRDEFPWWTTAAVVGAIAISAACTSLTLSALGRKTSPTAASDFSQILLGAIGVGLAVADPGLHYLATVPALFCALHAIAEHVFVRQPIHALFFTAKVAVGPALYVPILCMVASGLGAHGFWIISVLAGLATLGTWSCSPLSPLKTATTATAILLGALIAVSLSHPESVMRANSVLVVDRDARTTVAGLDSRDLADSELLPDYPDRPTVPYDEEFFWTTTRYFVRSVPYVEKPGPQWDITERTVLDDGSIRFSGFARASSEAVSLGIATSNPHRVRELKNGTYEAPLFPWEGWVMTDVIGPKLEGEAFSITIEKGEPLDLHVFEVRSAAVPQVDNPYVRFLRGDREIVVTHRVLE